MNEDDKWNRELFYDWFTESSSNKYIPNSYKYDYDYERIIDSMEKMREYTETIKPEIVYELEWDDESDSQVNNDLDVLRQHRANILRNF